MVYEVAWTRALSLVLGSSIYAFCIILATFLTGIALGSMIMRAWLRNHRATLQDAVRLEWGLGVYGLMSPALFNGLPQWLIALWPMTGRTFHGLLWLQWSLSGAVMAWPTLALGMLFPLVSELVTNRVTKLGRQLGTAYAVNTAGGIVGSFASGFLLIPWLGLPWAIITAALINLAAAGILAVRAAPHAQQSLRAVMAGGLVVIAAMAGALVIVPAWDPRILATGVYLRLEQFRRMSLAEDIADNELLYYKDSFNATVSVHRSRGDLFLKVGGKTDASTGFDMSTQVLAAHLPLLLHPHPDRALVIGLGSGVTLGHASRYPLSRIDCAELDPAVIEGARFFADYNYHVHENPRVHITAADGRNFLLANPRSYDVIISEPSNPWMAGVAMLFTREFYQLAKRRLAPGGMMCQWIQLYHIFPQDVQLLLKTFHEVFPYVSVWMPIPGDLLLIGSMEPQQRDSHWLATRMQAPAIQESLGVIRAHRPDVLLQSFLFGTRTLEHLTANIWWTHQDDLPEIEFRAPQALYLPNSLSVNVAGLRRFSDEPSTLISGYATPDRDSTFYEALAEWEEYRGDTRRALNALERCVTLAPRSSRARVRLAEVELKLQEWLKAEHALTEAIRLDRRNRHALRLLARLYRQQGQPSKALPLYQQLARLGVPDRSLAHELGSFYAQQEQWQLAAEYDRSALSQDTQRTQVKLVVAFAHVLYELKAWAEVERLLSRAVAIFPKEGALPLIMGKACLEQRRWPEALVWFQRAIALESSNAEAYYGCAQIGLALGRREEALRDLKQALLADPYYREALDLLRRLTEPTPSTELVEPPGQARDT